MLVSDSSYKGINVIKTIHRVAGSGVVKFDHAGAIINRVKDINEKNLVDLGDVELLGCILEDEQVRQFDIADRSLLELPEGPTTQAIREMLQTFKVL